MIWTITNKYSIKIEDEIVVLTQFIKNYLLIVTDSTVNIAQSGELKWSNQYLFNKGCICTG